MDHQPRQPIRVVFALLDGSLVLDWAGPAEALRIANQFLRERFPALEVVDDVRWVDNGRVVSSAGISAGIDMSLHLVERLAGRELALRTARQMDFAWTTHLRSPSA